MTSEIACVTILALRHLGIVLYLDILIDMMLGFNPVVDNDFVVGQYSLILNSLFWMH